MLSSVNQSDSSIQSLQYNVESNRTSVEHSLPVSGVSHQQLWRSIPARRNVIGVNLSRSGRHRPGEAKVTELDHTELRDQNVLRFNVPVNDLRDKHRISERSERHRAERVLTQTLTLCWWQKQMALRIW